MTDQVAPLKVPPVERSIVVACSPERAFQAFTAEIAKWWPVETHSVSQHSSTVARIEPGVDGRVYETEADGSEHEWGRILDWSSPHHFSTTWHPGRSSDTHQILELTFTAEQGRTRLRLVHRGFEVLGAEAKVKRDNYDAGWQKILEQNY